MATITKPKKRVSKINGVELKVSKTKKRKNPMNLYGILKDKIFYEREEDILSRY